MTHSHKILLALGLFFCIASINSQNLLVEAESFENPGGWVVDPQFVEQMGSPYLMAHGMGEKVKNATTKVTFDKAGQYHTWVRTMNWVPGDWEAPGKFRLKVANEVLEKTLGQRSGWGWEYVGLANIDKAKKVSLELIDLTGFNGRCDAIYFSTTKEEPPAAPKKLAEWRKTVKPMCPKKPKPMTLSSLVAVLQAAPLP